jgi:hypothetical protein
MHDLRKKIEVDHHYDCFQANFFDADQMRFIYYHEQSFKS